MSLLHQVIVASLAAFVAAQCPMDFFESGGRCYSVIDKPGVNMTWEECRGFCVLKGEGGEMATDLATFDNAEQLEAFSITWLDISQTIPEHPYMWIGAHKMDGEWMTLDGTKITLQNLMWHVGHPHDMGINVFLEDISKTTGDNSYGRLYYSCTMGMHEHHSRCLCGAK
ncbi:hypothetical protein GWK47_011034 [Chionoecetes opilio]|uniref:C-type lectin domain-containing protein n=1 Tax=Chionoecetes opilio TaxID=41210 RepID=A0A8J5CQ21_CHIOP|nr:hypothetical protein GWK47_011034 [Chionoecetes opilio]